MLLNITPKPPIFVLVKEFFHLPAAIYIYIIQYGCCYILSHYKQTFQFFEYAAWIYYLGMSAMCGWKMMMTPLQMAGVFVPHNKFIYFIPCSLGSSPEA